MVSYCQWLQGFLFLWWLATLKIDYFEIVAQICEYTKTTELYALNWRIVWYVNYLSGFFFFFLISKNHNHLKETQLEIDKWGSVQITNR